MKKHVGLPSEKEIAEGTIKYLIQTGKLRSEEDIQSLLRNVPFLNNHIRNSSVFFQELSSPKSIITPEELPHLHRQEFIEKKSSELTTKIIQERSEQIEKAIEEKKKEYSSIPSVLDEHTYNEPKGKSEDTTEDKEWWRVIGLSSDPFPRQEGLNKIPKEIYDQVIYRNELIQDYVNKIYTNRDRILNKGILIIGGFGTGKTTFFDYLTIHFMQHKIYPIRIVLPIRADIISYRADFTTAFYRELKGAHTRILNKQFEGEPSLDNCKEIMISLKKEGWSIVVMLDDLHKHIGYEKVVLNFLASLQIDKDLLIRGGVDIGFFVSGLPNWENYLKEDGALSGFFDVTPEKIGKITAKDALAVVNNRLQAFSLGYSKKNVIDIHWMEKIHRQIEEEKKIVNHRLIIDTVVETLRKNDFSILKDNYLEKVQSNIMQIREILDSHGTVKQIASAISEEKIRNHSNKIALIECLVRLYLDGGIREEDEDFEPSAFYLQQLLKSNIILKQKTADNKFKWVISPSVKDAFDEVQNQHGLSPEDYILKIYNLDKTEKRNQTSIPEFFTLFAEYEHLTRQQNNIQNIDALFSEFRYALELYPTLSEGPIDTQSFTNKVNTLIQALSALSRVVFLSHEFKNVPDKEKKVLEFWNDYWYSPNAVSQFITEVFYNSSPPTRQKLGLIAAWFKDACEEILQRETEIAKGNSPIRIPCPRLNKEEITYFTEFHKEFSSYHGKEYFESMKALNLLIERKLRVTLFNHFNIIWGEIKNRLAMYDDLETEFRKKGIDYGNMFFNEFESINRGEYKKLIINNKKLRQLYFKPLFSDLSSQDLESYLNLFCDTNIIAGHDKTQQIDSSDQSYVVRFVMSSIEFLKLLNEFYLELIMNSFFYTVQGDRVEGWFSPTGMNIEGSAPPKTFISSKIIDKSLIKNVKDVTPIVLIEEEIVSVYKKIQRFSNEDGNYTLDLENYDLIYNTFSIEYRKFFAILSVLWVNTQNKPEFAYPLKILRHYGTTIRLLVQPKSQKRLSEFEEKT